MSFTLQWCRQSAQHQRGRRSSVVLIRYQTAQTKGAPGGGSLVQVSQSDLRFFASGMS